MQPPGQSFRSSTTTCRPARASSAPQASELIPLPTRTTSGVSETVDADIDGRARPLQERGERTLLVGALDRRRERRVVDVRHADANRHLGADDLVPLARDL